VLGDLDGAPAGDGDTAGVAIHNRLGGGNLDWVRAANSTAGDLSGHGIRPGHGGIRDRLLVARVRLWPVRRRVIAVVPCRRRPAPVSS